MTHYTEYLKELASDHRESGSSATAEDIEHAADTIEMLLEALEGLLKCPDLNTNDTDRLSKAAITAATKAINKAKGL